MKPQSSLPYSQQPSIGPYSQPDKFSLQPSTLFLSRSIVILSFCLRLDLSRGISPSDFPHTILCASVSKRLQAVSGTYQFEIYLGLGKWLHHFVDVLSARASFPVTQAQAQSQPHCQSVQVYVIMDVTCDRLALPHTAGSHASWRSPRSHCRSAFVSSLQRGDDGI
jgi:hypothetical protein